MRDGGREGGASGARAIPFLSPGGTFLGQMFARLEFRTLCREKFVQQWRTLTLTLPMDIHVPTRSVLILETKDSFILFVTHLITKTMFVDSGYGYN